MHGKPLITTVLQLALGVVVTISSASQPMVAPSPPKPPDRYDGYTITSLADGKWLAAGGHLASGSSRDSDRVDLYDPTTGKWTKVEKLKVKRLYHTATLLSDGKVLVAGGQSGDDGSYLASAEVYDPAAGEWKTTGSMNQARAGHTLTLLANGSVLATGGVTNFVRGLLSSAEVYDPSTGTWTMTAPMNTRRVGHTAALLTNGLVLVACGLDEESNYRPSAELYDPAQRKWTMTGSLMDWIHWSYTATVLTNGLVLLTTSDTNAWVASKELYDPATGQWKAIGPRQPHFVSSRDTQPTLTILPQTGSSFLASEEIQLLVETSDSPGVTNISLFRDKIKVAETEEDPLRYDLTNAAAGTYVFVARASYANGLAATSSLVSLIFNAPGPQVSMTPLPSEHVASPYFHSSPATLMASVVGVSPGTLTNLTLNAVPQPLKTGVFALHAALAEGENAFVLTATDNQGRTASATNVVFLESRLPTISITSPTNNASLDVMRVDVRGTFSEQSLKQITVNGMPAFVRSNTFEALNVFLQPGTNIVSAVAENLAGSMTTNSLIISGPTGTNVYGIDPVQLIADNVAGFAPLRVSLRVQAKVPGEIRRVLYDFDGDHVIDRTEPDLRPVSVTFQEPGERFPVATVETTSGRFSSLGQGGWFFPGTRINVQASPVQLAVIKVPDPVAIKCVPTNRLYVLSGSTATLTEFDAQGKVIRSRQNLGGSPMGFDVDEARNVYLALSASNQVWKFKPTAESFEPDVTFGNGGFIGNKDGTSGSQSNELNAPFGVAVTRDSDGVAILVSDCGNHRIQRFTEHGQFDSGHGFHVNRDGAFVSTFGEAGTNTGQFRGPKGICFGGSHGFLLIADSGNNRVAVANHEFGPEAMSGETGTALGQFREPINLCESDRGLCVADLGNNRIQLFDPVNGGGERGPLAPFRPRVALSTELGLNHPRAVTWVEDLLEEKLYIADTGNNRVLLVKLPSDNPEAVWDAMKRHLLKGDINGAVSYFASREAEKYRESYLAIGTNELVKIVSEIPSISPISIEREKAQYYFQQKVNDALITFPIEFVRENGHWKIEEY